MSRTDPQFNLRIPESLRDKVMSAAKSNKRSATAEILARLEKSFLTEAVEDDEGHMTFQIHRDQIASAIEGPTFREEKILSAMLKALREVESSGLPPDNAKPQPNTGPKSRKRFPKE